MQGKPNRRPRGTGEIFEKHDAYYGRWHVKGKKVLRKLGPVRKPGSRQGLTKTQAEARLRELMSQTAKAPALVVEGGMTIDEVGARHIKHLLRKGRKPDTTLANYESELRVHLVPQFGTTPIDQITAEDIEDLIDVCLSAGLAVKTVRNLLTHLNSIFEFAIRQHWRHDNPCKDVEKPAAPQDGDQEIRFLDQSELSALLRSAGAGLCRHTPRTLERGARARVLRDIERLEWKQVGAALGCSAATAIYLYRATADAVIEDDLRPVERVLYMTAAMTGLRQGELLALRWCDVDWPAQKIRVRRNYVRGKFGTPKSKRSSRAVPMADQVGGELDKLYQSSAYRSDEHLVFGHPHTGKPLERSQVLKRFKAALRAAAVREVRFHDLRHTFGTRMAAAGVPMRTLQEWMGHRDIKTTQIYADYAPAANEAALVNAAFAPAVPNTVPELNESGANSDQQNPDELGVFE
jgi:integrase